MKFKNNIKKYIVVFMCFTIISFVMSCTCANNIVYAYTSSHVNAKGLGENIFSGSNSVVGDLSNQGGIGTEANTTDHKKRYTKFNNALYKVWGVILVVLQVASIAGVIFAGVRYMFASADAKADLKKSMIHLVIGMIIVFGASTVVGFIIGTFKEMASPLI